MRTAAWASGRADQFPQADGCNVGSAYFGKPVSETDKEKENGINLEPWPDNAMGHTCATYSCAATQDTVRVSAMLGNTPDVLHKHYRGLATQEDAKRFFALRAAGAAQKIVPLTVSQ